MLLMSFYLFLQKQKLAVCMCVCVCVCVYVCVCARLCILVVYVHLSLSLSLSRLQTAGFRSGETCPEAGSKRALPSDKLGPSPQNRLPVNNVRVRGQVGPYTQHKRDGTPAERDEGCGHGAWSLRTLWKWCVCVF